MAPPSILANSPDSIKNVTRVDLELGVWCKHGYFERVMQTPITQMLYTIHERKNRLSKIVKI